MLKLINKFTFCLFVQYFFVSLHRDKTWWHTINGDKDYE